MQVEISEIALAGVSERLLRRVDTADRTGADRSAEETRVCKRRAPVDERVVELAGTGTFTGTRRKSTFAAVP